MNKKVLKHKESVDKSFYNYPNEVEHEDFLSNEWNDDNKENNDPTSKAEDLHEKGTKSLQNNNFDKAIQYLEESLDCTPDTETYLKLNNYRYLGDAYFYKREYNKSINFYRKIRNFFPEDDSSYYDTALAYFELKDYDNALDEINGLKAIGNFNFDAQLLAGRIYIQKGNFSDAKEIIKSINFDLRTARTAGLMYMFSQNRIENFGYLKELYKLYTDDENMDEEPNL
jgi:tetratricopeptide (TPR) repeat protein